MLCWMLGWYLLGREVSIISEVSVGAFLDARLMTYWMLRWYLGCKVGTIWDVRLLLFCMFD